PAAIHYRSVASTRPGRHLKLNTYVDFAQIDEAVFISVLCFAKQPPHEVFGEQAGAGRGRRVVGQRATSGAGDHVPSGSCQLYANVAALEHTAAAAVEDDDRAPSYGLGDELVDPDIAHRCAQQPIRPSVSAAEEELVALIEQPVPAVVKQQQVVAVC